MTDYKATVALFCRLGLEFEETFENGERYGIEGQVTKITLSTGHPKIKGYNGFASTYLFNNQGDFVELHIWE